MKKEIDIVEDWLELNDDYKSKLLSKYKPRMISEQMQLYSIGDMIEILEENKIEYWINSNFSVTAYKGEETEENYKCKAFKIEKEMCNALWDCIKWCLKEGLI